MEYASGGELFNKITTGGRIAENEAKNLFAQVISAVQYMVSCLNKIPFVII
jgi:serine/threonine protein kinase